MDMVQFFTLLGSILGAFIFLYREIQEMKKEMRGIENRFAEEIKRVENKLSEEIKRVENKLLEEIKTVENKLTDKISDLQKELQQTNTRVAVIESKLSDISNNVSHLMWYSQSMPPKAEEF
jgi:predicted  nucleic acid-binding Zn-ribbon protein